MLVQPILILYSSQMRIWIGNLLKGQQYGQVKVLVNMTIQHMWLNNKSLEIYSLEQGAVIGNENTNLKTST